MDEEVDKEGGEGKREGEGNGGNIGGGEEEEEAQKKKKTISRHTIARFLRGSLYWISF